MEPRRVRGGPAARGPLPLLQDEARRRVAQVRQDAEDTRRSVPQRHLQRHEDRQRLQPGHEGRRHVRHDRLRVWADELLQPQRHQGVHCRRRLHVRADSPERPPGRAQDLGRDGDGQVRVRPGHDPGPARLPRPAGEGADEPVRTRFQDHRERSSGTGQPCRRRPLRVLQGGEAEGCLARELRRRRVPPHHGRVRGPDRLRSLEADQAMRTGEQEQRGSGRGHSPGPPRLLQGEAPVDRARLHAADRLHQHQ